MMNNSSSISLLLFIILPLLSSFAAASTFIVPSSQYRTIADAAFVAVNDGDVIQVVNDVIGCGNNTDGAVLRASVVIVGKEGMMPTVDCLRAGRAITAIDISSVKIENIRFVNGYSASSGGAVYVGGKIDRVEIRGCEFLNNVANGNFSNDKGVFNGGGGLAIFGRFYVEIIAANNTFTNNTAPSGIGGGAAYIFLSSASGVTLDDRSNQYVGGSAYSGGGVGLYVATEAESSRLKIGNEGAIFADNISFTCGGAVAAFFGFFITHSTLIIGSYNSYFEANSALDNGGAIWMNLGSADHVEVTVASQNSTIISNSAPQVYAAADSLASVDISILGGIFASAVALQREWGVLETNVYSPINLIGSAQFSILSGAVDFFGNGFMLGTVFQSNLYFLVNPRAVFHIKVFLFSLGGDCAIQIDGQFSSSHPDIAPVMHTLLCLLSCCLLLISLLFPRCVHSLDEPNNNYQRLRPLTMCSGLIFSFILVCVRLFDPTWNVLLTIFVILPGVFAPLISACSSLVFIVKPQHKIFITDESMRLTMILLSLFFLLISAGSQAVDDLWIVPSMLAVILVTWPPLGIRTSLWHRLQSDIKRDVLTIRKERLLVISGVLGQMIVITCWMMPFVWTASSESGHILRTLMSLHSVSSFPLQLLLFSLATFHVYANNELYPVLQKRHQERINNDQRTTTIATIEADEATRTMNIIKKSQLIAGVAAFSPLLGVASIAVCVAAVWIPMTANEQAAVITMGVIGIIRCLLQQIALMKKRGRRHRDIAANELSLPSFMRSMMEMWRQSSSLGVKQCNKDMIKPIGTFFGSWIGMQWMVIMNGLMTSIPLMIMLAADKIPNSSLLDMLIGLGAANVVVAGMSLFGDVYPQYKIIPVDESFRLISILKSLMLAVKGLILAESTSKTSPEETDWHKTAAQLLNSTLLAQYIFTFAFSFFLTFVNVRTLWKMSSKLPIPNGRIFLVGYCWSFAITKIAAILLPFVDKLGEVFFTYQGLSADCDVAKYNVMTADQLQLVFTALAIGLFFSVTMNNETAYLLETSKKMLGSNISDKQLSSEGIAAISTVIPMSFLGLIVKLILLLIASSRFEGQVGCTYNSTQCPIFIICLSIAVAMLFGFFLLEFGLMRAPFWSRLSKSKAVVDLSTDVEMTSIQRDSPNIKVSSC